MDPTSSNSVIYLFMNKGSRIYIAGHTGLVGKNTVAKLKEFGYKNIIYPENRIDLENEFETEDFFEKNNIEYVIFAAAKVGGIKSNNSFPVEFITKNLAIEMNVIKACFKYKIKKLLFLGSSCIYPRNCPQPIKEEYLMTGTLEKTNSAYAVAKIAGIEMCKAYNKQYGTNYICAMPTNLYGINDNFDLNNSHVLPAMIRKFHEAKLEDEPIVELWGTGNPRREFLYAEDLAEALIYLLNHYDAKEDDNIINVGSGVDITISDLANIISDTVGFKGGIFWDISMPDGTSRKLLDISKIKKLGWEPKYSLEEGVSIVYKWYCKL